MTDFVSRNFGGNFVVTITTDKKDHYTAAQDFARVLVDSETTGTAADDVSVCASLSEAVTEYRNRKGASPERIFVGYKIGMKLLRDEWDGIPISRVPGIEGLYLCGTSSPVRFAEDYKSVFLPGGGQ